jgi:hypothetical protein
MMEIKIKLQPFRVPNYVLPEPRVSKRQDGVTMTEKYHLRELDKETLEQLCDEFRAGVFAKAATPKP